MSVENIEKNSCILVEQISNFEGEKNNKTRIEETSDESPYKSNTDVGTASDLSEEDGMKKIDVQQVIKSVNYLNKQFFSLKSMKYLMVKKMKVKELRKFRETNGVDCSVLGPHEVNIQVGRYKRDEKGGYKLDKDGKKIKTFTLKIRWKKSIYILLGKTRRL